MASMWSIPGSNPISLMTVIPTSSALQTATRLHSGPHTPVLAVGGAPAVQLLHGRALVAGRHQVDTAADAVFGHQVVEGQRQHAKSQEEEFQSGQVIPFPPGRRSLKQTHLMTR